MTTSDDEYDKFREEELRKRRLARKPRDEARHLKNAAADIARGSEHLLLKVTTSRTVLIWTDTVQYPEFPKSAGLKRTISYVTFRSALQGAGFSVSTQNVPQLSEENQRVVGKLRMQYPSGGFFVPKTDLANAKLVNAIAAATADLDNRAPSQQPPAQRKQAKAKGRKTNERQEESEEELETSEAEDTEESENDEESEDAEGSETIEESEDDGEKEEGEEDQEEDEEDENNQRIVSGSGQGAKRLRETDSSEEDADDEEPPSPPVKPKRKQNKSIQSQKANLVEDHTAAMQAIVAAAQQYAAGVQARAKVRKDRRRKMQAHYKQAREFANLANKARLDADAYNKREKEARAKGDHQMQRDSEEEEEDEEAEANREALDNFV